MRRIGKGAVGAALGLVLVLAGCSSSSKRPEPAALPAVSGSLTVSKGWSTRLGEVSTPLQAVVIGTRVILASTQGLLLELDADTGREVWRQQLNAQLIAGVGSDGKRHAVITSGNELIVSQAGREIWRQKLSAQTFTAPLVAGERVFVQTADRSVVAYDGASGQRLWALQRNADPLVLRQAGVLAAVGDTLLAGNGGRLSAIAPLNGQVRWDVVIGSSRGTNEVERLVDLVAGVGRQDDQVCARAFQAAVGCVDTRRGTVLWKGAAEGSVGLASDEQQVYGVEDDGRVLAWRRSGGEQVWRVDALRYRQLGAPLVLGRAVAVGDASGLIHLLSRADGSTLARLATDGSAIAATPVEAAGTLVAVTRNGAVFGFRPQ